MSLHEILTPTGVARAGMTVSALFAECLRVQIPGLPFLDGSGRIAGKASLRHVLKVNCLPDYLVQHSHLLGDSIEHVRFPEIRCREIMERTIDDIVVADVATIGVNAPVSKALARMEQHDTTYLFVLDADGSYLGATSILRLAGFLHAQSQRP
jgi:CBS-domain-containing membrane protein